MQEVDGEQQNAMEGCITRMRNTQCTKELLSLANGRAGSQGRRRRMRTRIFSRDSLTLKEKMMPTVEKHKTVIGCSSTTVARR